MPQLDFVGGAYEAANAGQDAQELINWYVEIDGQPSAKTPLALLGVPGLEEAVSSSFTGEVRGGHVMPSGTEAYLVIGNQLVKMTTTKAATATSYATFALAAVGTLNTSAGHVSMADNATAAVLAIGDGYDVYAYITRKNTLRVVGDAPSCDRIASIDGWFIFNKTGTQFFYTSPPYWNGTDAFDQTYFALKDNGPDNLVSLIESNRQLWLLGSQTTEVWYNAGGAQFPFARLQGAMLQIGCAAAQTVVRTGKGLMFLASSERGENFIARTNGYDYEPIPNPAFSHAITQYKVISDAFAYVYTEEGHEFYVITFPTQDVTWVYDLTTEFWHKRQSLDPATGQKHRQRANCLINFQGQRIVGDYKTGQVWRQTRTVFSDGGNPLVALRRTGYVWDKSERARICHHRLQIEINPGAGTSTGQGKQPSLMVRWLDEGGWSNERMVAVGQIGKTKHRAILRKLGSSRSRLYEVSISDPVSRDIVGASLEVTPTQR